ncbi:MAG: flagellar hook basal-body protein [Pirellulaceae bacterium]
MQTNLYGSIETMAMNEKIVSSLALRVILLFLVGSFALSTSGCKNSPKKEARTVRVWPPNGVDSSDRSDDVGIDSYTSGKSTGGDYNGRESSSGATGFEVSDESSDYRNYPTTRRLPSTETDAVAPIVAPGQMLNATVSKELDEVVPNGQDLTRRQFGVFLNEGELSPFVHPLKDASGLGIPKEFSPSDEIPSMASRSRMADLNNSVVRTSHVDGADSAAVQSAHYDEQEVSPDAAVERVKQASIQQPIQFRKGASTVAGGTQSTKRKTLAVPDEQQNDTNLTTGKTPLIPDAIAPFDRSRLNDALKTLSPQLVNVDARSDVKSRYSIDRETLPPDSPDSQSESGSPTGATDLAIEGRGYFQVTAGFGRGETVYTRRGDFKINTEGVLVLGGDPSRQLDPPVVIPIEASGIVIEPNGEVFYRVPSNQSQKLAGRIRLASFTKSAGLLDIGDNLWKSTRASGNPILGTPGEAGLGVLKSGQLEKLSNTSATAFANEDWQTAISRSIDQLDRDIARETDLIAKQRLLASQGVLHAVLQDRVAAMRPIEVDGISPDVQKFWSEQNLALIEMLDPLGTPQGSRRARSAFGHLKEAQRQLSAASELGVRNVAFCEKVQGFGRYEEFRETKFRVDDAVVLYAELENFAVDTTADGYETEFQGGFEVYDDEGFRVAQHEFLLVEQTCRNIQTDYFLPYIMHIPKNLGPGKYRLRLTVEDRKGNKFGQSGPLEFEVTK